MPFQNRTDIFFIKCQLNQYRIEVKLIIIAIEKDGWRVKCKSRQPVERVKLFDFFKEQTKSLFKTNINKNIIRMMCFSLLAFRMYLLVDRVQWKPQSKNIFIARKVQTKYLKTDFTNRTFIWRTTKVETIYSHHSFLYFSL